MILSQGARGQHLNKTESVMRVVHINGNRELVLFVSPDVVLVLESAENDAVDIEIR